MDRTQIRTLFAQKRISGFKNADDLADEVERGESSLVEVDGRLVRRVRTAAVIVTHEGRVLRESSYERSGKRIVRALPWSIAEKCISDESFEDAAMRALREELGASGDLIFVNEELVVGDSPAYPGIGLENTIRTYRCELPEARERYVEEQATGRIVWEWDRETELHRTLLSLYTQYLKDPRSERVRSALRELAKDQEGLMSYAEHASEPPVSSDVLRALNNIDLMTQYGSYPQDHPLADDELLRTAREIRDALSR